MIAFIFPFSFLYLHTEHNWPTSKAPNKIWWFCILALKECNQIIMGLASSLYIENRGTKKKKKKKEGIIFELVDLRNSLFVFLCSQDYLFILH